MAPLVAFIPLIAAGIGAATTAVSLAEKPGTPKAPTQVESNSQQAATAQAAALAQANTLSKRRGQASTTLTSPTGAGSGTTQTATLGT